MAGITNTSYRKIIKEMQAGLIYAEMVSDKALVYSNEKTFDLLKMTDAERPIAQQIFGSDIESFVKAAKIVEDTMHPDIIDINMGCPVPKVALKNQAGSALLKNPQKIKEIVSAVVKTVVEAAGASAIAVHARTRSQGYSGKADWNIIKQVKEAVNIPVIGNGDVTSCFLAKKMLEETKCDAVMIGRGVLGNPWLIKECVEYLETNKLPEKVTNTEKINMMKRHYNLLLEDKCEKLANLEIRSHILYYLKGMPRNKEIKNQICQCRNKNELISTLDNYEKYLKEEGLE